MGRVVKWLVWPVVFGVPVLFLVIGSFLMVEAAFFQRNSVATTGTVVEPGSPEPTEGAPSGNAPLLSYEHQEHGKLTARTHVSSAAYDWEKGAEVAIRYLPEEPGSVRVDAFWSLWLIPLAFTAMGAVFLPISLAIRRIFRRRSDAG